MSIIIDQEFQKLIPPLSAEEFKQLEENCVKEGIRDALVVWVQDDGNEILVDGHNRWKIAVDHQLTPNFVGRNFADREEAKAWILRNQLGRRNLPTYVRVQLALKLKPVIAAKAKETQGTRTDLCQKSDRSKTDTKKELATIAGVSHDTINKVEVIEKKAPEEIKAKARTGEISINEAHKQTVNLMRPLKKADPVKQAEAEHREFEQKKTEKIVSLKDASIDADNMRILALEFSRNVSKAFNAVQNITLLKDDVPGVIGALTAEEQHTTKQNITTMISCLSIINDMVRGANGKT